MITDDICEALVGYIEGGADSELATAAVSVRDSGADVTIPAVHIGEDGDPDEDDIVRGTYLVPIEVVLATRPEDDERGIDHLAMTRNLVSLLADSAAVIEHREGGGRCWDSWGGQGRTGEEDGLRLTMFQLRIKAGPL